MIFWKHFAYLYHSRRLSLFRTSSFKRPESEMGKDSERKEKRKRKLDEEGAGSSAGKKPKTKEEKEKRDSRVSGARRPEAESKSSGRMKEKAGGKTLDSVNKTTVENKKERTGASESASEVKRNKKGQLVFEDHPEFQPNMSPKEVLQAGSFGGTYFRPIYSSITKQQYKDEWKELPPEWLQGLDINKQVASVTYREEVNTYKVKCGGSLEMWESSGWIKPQDPYGWFHWYCRFYQGRRTEDDARQISRWAKCAGVKGRWRNNLITKVVRSGRRFDDPSVSPVVRQTLQHWGYRLTEEDYRQGAKRVKPQ